jgi:hypothetical protein
MPTWRLVTLLFLFLYLPLGLFAQQKPPVLIGVYSQHAALVKHSPKMEHLIGSYPKGLEVNLQFQTTGKQPWHREYQYPRIGVSMIWFEYGNPIIGQSLAISPYISKSFYRSEKREFNFRLGTGLAYFTNRFSLEDNPQNIVISSSVNAVMQTRFEYDHKITDHLSFMAALGLNHYSNGATRKPNLGVNLPTLSLGLTYHSQPRFMPVQSEEVPFEKGVFVDASTTMGIKHLTPIDPDRYLVNSVSLAVGYQANRKSNLVAGVEGFYDRSLHIAQQGDPSLPSGGPMPDVRRVGVFGGHELVFGKLSFQTHLGFYTYRPYKYHKFYYQRLGLKYFLTNTMFAALDLKAHAGSADVIECRLGLRLHRLRQM